MNAPPFDVDKAHRWFAVELNNRSWDLIEAKARTAQEDQLLIHTAHASTYHWLQAGTPLNHQRALCLLANAYNAVGDYAPALRYAQGCLELHGKNSQQATPFDEATAYECLARAQAGLGKADQARRHKQLARAAAEKLEAADREVFDGLLKAGEWHGVD